MKKKAGFLSDLTKEQYGNTSIPKNKTHQCNGYPSLRGYHGLIHSLLSVSSCNPTFDPFLTGKRGTAVEGC